VAVPPKPGEAAETLLGADAVVDVDLPGSDFATPTESSPVTATEPAASQPVLERRSCTARSLWEIGFTGKVGFTGLNCRRVR